MTFKTWLLRIEEDSTSTGDIAGNPYGAGIQRYDKKRDVFGTLAACKKDKKCGLDKGLGGTVRTMSFSSGDIGKN